MSQKACEDFLKEEQSLLSVTLAGFLLASEGGTLKELVPGTWLEITGPLPLLVHEIITSSPLKLCVPATAFLCGGCVLLMSQESKS